MPKNRDSGFQSAAGLIRYFDQEDEKAIKVNPWLVLGMCIALSVLVLVVEFAWPVT